MALGMTLVRAAKHTPAGALLPCVGVERINYMHLQHYRFSTEQTAYYARSELKRKRGAIISEL